MVGEVLQSFAVGLLLGALFFGGLWLTIRRGLTARNPAIWFGVSALLRMAIIVVGFYVLAGSGLAALLSGLIGLLAARFGVKRYAAQR